MKNIITSILLLICMNNYSQEKKDITIKTEVSEATVFIKGAQVLRKKTIELNEGKSTLKFTELSPYLDPKSIQVRANGKVIVLSVNHQFNYLDTASRPKDLQELNSKLLAVMDKLEIENANLEIINDEITFIKDNRIIGGKSQELSLVNLKQTSDYYSERISTLKMKEIEVNKNKFKLELAKSSIEKQINQISSNKLSPVSEVLIKVDSKAQTSCEFELSYLVNNAGWFPSYDIRSNSVKEPIRLIYKANIHQSTKEEWKNVKLKLSSSDPDLGSVAPQLQTYYLSYNSLPPKYNNIQNQVTGRIFDSKTNQPIGGANIIIKGTTIGTIADLNGNYSLSVPDNSSELQVSFIGYESQNLPISNQVMNIGLNESALALEEVVVTAYGTKKKSDLTGSVSMIDLNGLEGRVSGVNISKAKRTSNIFIPTEKVQNQTSFEFEVKTPYTVNSDNKNITVDLDEYSLNADYEYYCIPKIDKDAFLIANIVDWEKYNLLAGEASIFFENTFVGKSILDVRYISDTLNLSLGRDKNVIVKRDKIKDFTTKQFLGNKKEETRAWHISVKNNKQQPINMVIFDQVPVSTLEEIEVGIDNISGAFLDKDKGEVKWKFSLEPAAKKEFELKYKVKYPKYRTLLIE